MIRIEARHFVAAVLLEGDRFSGWNVVEAAPILRYMIGWPAGKVFAYCRSKGWVYG